MDDQTTSSRRSAPPSDARLITVTTTIRSNRISFLWLKHVRAFNPQAHCARCLIGRYADLYPFGRQVAGKIINGRLPVEPGEILYLCAVTWDYEANVHLPMRVAGSESVITLETADISLRITGAEPLEFPGLPDGHNDLSAAFTTCRNYQFGLHAAEQGWIATTPS